MSVETEVFDALKGLVGNRVYPIVFPQPDERPVWPAIRYTIVSAVPDAIICGDTEETDSKRVQLDLVDTTAAGVKALRSSVMTAMAGLPTPAVNEGSYEEYDEPTRTCRIVMDYTIHTSSA